MARLAGSSILSTSASRRKQDQLNRQLKDHDEFPWKKVFEAKNALLHLRKAGSGAEVRQHHQQAAPFASLSEVRRKGPASEYRSIFPKASSSSTRKAGAEAHSQQQQQQRRQQEETVKEGNGRRRFFPTPGASEASATTTATSPSSSLISPLSPNSTPSSSSAGFKPLTAETLRLFVKQLEESSLVHSGDSIFRKEEGPYLQIKGREQQMNANAVRNADHAYDTVGDAGMPGEAGSMRIMMGNGDANATMNADTVLPRSQPAGLTNSGRRWLEQEYHRVLSEMKSSTHHKGGLPVLAATAEKVATRSLSAHTTSPGAISPSSNGSIRTYGSFGTPEHIDATAFLPAENMGFSPTAINKDDCEEQMGDFTAGIASAAPRPPVSSCRSCLPYINELRRIGTLSVSLTHGIQGSIVDDVECHLRTNSRIPLFIIPEAHMTVEHESSEPHDSSPASTDQYLDSSSRKRPRSLDMGVVPDSPQPYRGMTPRGFYTKCIRDYDMAFVGVSAVIVGTIQHEINGEEQSVFTIEAAVQRPFFKISSRRVSRTFSDFVWLSEALYWQFGDLLLPKLPSIAAGLHKKVEGLNKFLQWVCLHPRVHKSRLVLAWLQAGLGLKGIYRLQKYFRGLKGVLSAVPVRRLKNADIMIAGTVNELGHSWGHFTKNLSRSTVKALKLEEDDELTNWAASGVRRVKKLDKPMKKCLEAFARLEDARSKQEAAMSKLLNAFLETSEQMGFKQSTEVVETCMAQVRESRERHLGALARCRKGAVDALQTHRGFWQSAVRGTNLCLAAHRQYQEQMWLQMKSGEKLSSARHNYFTEVAKAKHLMGNSWAPNSKYIPGIQHLARHLQALEELEKKHESNTQKTRSFDEKRGRHHERMGAEFRHYHTSLHKSLSKSLAKFVQYQAVSSQQLHHDWCNVYSMFLP